MWLVPALSCSQSQPTAKPEDPSKSRASGTSASASDVVNLSTEGPAYALHLDKNSLTFCDKGGQKRLDLKTGKADAQGGTCPKIVEPNTGCGGLSIDVSVRGPLSEPNDIVDLSDRSFPLKGRVHDCSADGKLLAIVTGSSVYVIDVSKEVSAEVDHEGGDRVVIGSGWIAWTDGSKLHAKSLP